MARLLFFGKLADIAGGRARNETLANDVRTISDIVESLHRNDEALGAALRQSSVRFVVNEQIVGVDAEVSDGDEIAFLPPVSGG